MNQNIEELDTIEFKEEIAQRLELDFEKDIFDLIDETSNIIDEKRKILDLYTNKNIELCELDTTGLENIKEIKCYYVSIRDKEDYDEYTYIIFDDLEKARKYYNDFLLVKTLEDWNKSPYNYFESFCKPGDIVSQDIIDYFTNSVPPVTNYNNFVQAGEPYDGRLDPEDFNYKNTYTTFEKENGQWIYRGNCFKNKNKDTSNLVDDFEVRNNIEDYKTGYLLLQDNNVVAFLRKNGWEIDIEAIGETKIIDKNGNNVELDGEKLAELIKNETLDDKYDVIGDTVLQVHLYKQNKEGDYEYHSYTWESFDGIEEIGTDFKDIMKYMEETLDYYTKNEREIEEEEENVQ